MVLFSLLNCSLHSISKAVAYKVYTVLLLNDNDDYDDGSISGSVFCVAMEMPDNKLILSKYGS